MPKTATIPTIPNNVKGKDLFDSQLWKDPISTSVFYTFISSLRKRIHEEVKRATHTHRFIRHLRDTRKLVRCYTQNIDGLEGTESLCTDLTQGKGNRARFSKKSLDRSRSMARTQPGGDLDGGCEVVQLHGDLDVLRCTLCQQTCPWEDRSTRILLSGKAPTCQLCTAANQDRQDRGKRGTKIGTLRPNIVLYGEEHPSAEAVGEITNHDLNLTPDILLILGTSLHVHGLKFMVREFAKAVHSKAAGKGKVIFVNLTRPSESVWKDVLDYWVSMDCDEWVGAMRKHRPDMWQIQQKLELSVTKPKAVKMSQNESSNGALSGFEGKENVVLGTASTPTRKHPIPKVVLSPKKKQPLHDQSSNIEHQCKGAISTIETDEFQSEPLQLPTPPPTGHREKLPAKSRKRSAQNYQDLCSSPSKRPKTSVAIWED